MPSIFEMSQHHFKSITSENIFFQHNSVLFKAEGQTLSSLQKNGILGLTFPFKHIGLDNLTKQSKLDPP